VVRAGRRAASAPPARFIIRVIRWIGTGRPGCSWLSRGKDSTRPLHFGLEGLLGWRGGLLLVERQNGINRPRLFTMSRKEPTTARQAHVLSRDLFDQTMPKAVREGPDAVESVQGMRDIAREYIRRIFELRKTDGESQRLVRLVRSEQSTDFCQEPGAAETGNRAVPLVRGGGQGPPREV
jgi:hypothetical protein